MTPLEYGHYTLFVVPRKLSKSHTKDVSRAALMHGLRHRTLEDAERAAVAISRNHFVDRVDVKLIVEEFKGAWKNGERTMGL